MQIAPMRDSAGRVTLIVSVQYEVSDSPWSGICGCPVLSCAPTTSNVLRLITISPLFVRLLRFLVPRQQCSPLLYQAIWVGCTRPWMGLRQTDPLLCRCPPPQKAPRHPLREAVRHLLMIEADLTMGQPRGAGRPAVGTPPMTTGQQTGSAIKVIPISTCIAPSRRHNHILVNPCRSLLHLILISGDYLSHEN